MCRISSSVMVSETSNKEARSQKPQRQPPARQQHHEHQRNGAGPRQQRRSSKTSHKRPHPPCSSSSPSTSPPAAAKTSALSQPRVSTPLKADTPARSSFASSKCFTPPSAKLVPPPPPKWVATNPALAMAPLDFHGTIHLRRLLNVQSAS